MEAMAYSEARERIEAHYGDPEPHRRFSDQWTPRGFYERAAREFARFADAKRADGGQDEFGIVRNEEMARACRVLADAMHEEQG